MFQSLPTEYTSKRLRERSQKKDGPPVGRLWFGLLQGEWKDSLTKSNS